MQGIKIKKVIALSIFISRPGFPMALKTMEKEPHMVLKSWDMAKNNIGTIAIDHFAPKNTVINVSLKTIKNPIKGKTKRQLYKVIFE